MRLRRPAPPSAPFGEHASPQDVRQLMDHRVHRQQPHPEAMGLPHRDHADHVANPTASGVVLARVLVGHRIPAIGFRLDHSPSVTLSPRHAAAVNRQRRIFFHCDPASRFGSNINQVMSYLFDAVSQPGRQLDAICLDVSNEGAAHYRSKLLPAIQHPGLARWREQGINYFHRLIEQGHQRNKETWWGLRINQVERGDLASYDPRIYAQLKERDPVKAAHPDWLIRSWW